jgi:hypothetical protein
VSFTLPGYHQGRREVPDMEAEGLKETIESLRARIIAIRDSL